MRRMLYIAVPLLAATVALALTTVDLAPITTPLGTNSVTTGTTVGVSGKLTSITFRGQPTSTFSIVTTAGVGSSKGAAKTLLGTTSVTAQYVTNLAVPIYLREDTVSMVISNAGVLAITNNAAILFLEDP